MAQKKGFSVLMPGTFEMILYQVSFKHQQVREFRERLKN